MSDQGITILAVDPRGYVAQRPRKKSQVVGRYSSIAAGGAVTGAVFESIFGHTRNLKVLSKASLLWAAVAVVFNGSIDLVSKLFNRN